MNSIRKLSNAIGLTSAAALQKSVGDTLTVQISMDAPAAVHLLGFGLHFGPEFDYLVGASTWGALGTPDDADFLSRDYGMYCEYSLGPTKAGIPAGPHVIAEIKLKCVAPMSAATVELVNFIASTYKDNAPAPYETEVTQAPALDIVMQQPNAKAIVSVVIS